MVRMTGTRGLLPVASVLLLAACASAPPLDSPGPQGAEGGVAETTPEAPADDGPLLRRGLEAVGIRPADAGLSVRGWAQQGIHENLGGEERDDYRGVDDDPGVLQLRQAVLVVETEAAEGEGLAAGGRLKLLYGSDARATRAAGLDVGGSHRGERFDLLEAVATLEKGGSLPLTLEGGRFLSPHGYESVEAPANDFPSRGLLFTYATPTTHAGGRLTARPSERLSLAYAATRGWDNWEDPNGRLSHTIGGAYRADGGSPGWAANLTAGPEDDEGHHRRVLADTTATWMPGGGDTALALNALRGSEEEAAPGGRGARWWGMGAYASRPLGSAASAAIRAEYLRDDGGSRTGTDGRLAQVSASLTLRPIRGFDAFRVRIEGRYDRSLAERLFDGGRDRDQATLSLDWILEF
jgi:hypothetical protein